MAESALFTRDGDRFLPSELTRGGWSEEAQHGGPPAGLLAWAIEHQPSDVPMTVVRLTFDLLRPVPLQPITVSASVVRPGRRVQLVEARLTVDGSDVARAIGLRIRATEVPLPELPVQGWQPPPGPEKGSPPQWSGWESGTAIMPRFHHDAVDVRSLDGSFERPGPGLAWYRLRYPLVTGEDDTPVTRVATISDMGNGASATMDPLEFLWVNPDITVYLHRASQSEWIGMRSVAYQSDQGFGVSDSVVFDDEGPIGRILQAQLIDRRL